MQFCRNMRRKSKISAKFVEEAQKYFKISPPKLAKKGDFGTQKYKIDIQYLPSLQSKIIKINLKILNIHGKKSQRYHLISTKIMRIRDLEIRFIDKYFDTIQNRQKRQKLPQIRAIISTKKLQNDNTRTKILTITSK